ncbi:MAG TPA: OmpW family outer membrane protein [Caulobacter sp.]|nr:OmpW family outer membrane protein [Caulobacter sp.]
MKTVIATAVIAAALAAAGAASAQTFEPKAAGTVLVDFRATSVAPDESGSILTSGGVDTGLDVKVNNDTIPSLGLSYFITDKVAVELILGTSKHEISATTAPTATPVHDTWVLPPVLSLQYHPLPAARFSPYVGAGVNYMIFYNGKDRNGFKVDLDNGFGYSLQAGVDIAVQGPWSVNVDVKKVFFDTEASINNGALRSDVTLDPLVVSVGLGRKF